MKICIVEIMGEFGSSVKKLNVEYLDISGSDETWSSIVDTNPVFIPPSLTTSMKFYNTIFTEWS